MRFAEFCEHHSEDEIRRIVSEKDSSKEKDASFTFKHRAMKREGFTLLNYAIYKDCRDTVKLLIHHGAG